MLGVGVKREVIHQRPMQNLLFLKYNVGNGRKAALQPLSLHRLLINCISKGAYFYCKNIKNAYPCSKILISLLKLFEGILAI